MVNKATAYYLHRFVTEVVHGQALRRVVMPHATSEQPDAVEFEPNQIHADFTEAIKWIASVIAGFLIVFALTSGTPRTSYADESGNSAAEPTTESAENSSDESSGPDLGGANNSINFNQLPDSSFLYDTDIAELSEADSFHDSQIVQVHGQVVGDLINDESDQAHCWITLQEIADNPDEVVMVYVTREQAALVDTYGRYGVQGTLLQVRGVYHLSCAEHQGLSDIHADEAAVLEKGKETPLEVNNVIAPAGIALVLIGLVLFLIYRWRSDQEK